MFDTALLEKRLATSWLGSSFLFFEELDSTNACAKALHRGSSVHGTVVFSDHQTAGRGQYQRKWISQRAENITVSFIFQPGSRGSLTLLTLAMALAVSELLKEHMNLEKPIKWPNDVICDGKKIAGLLTETVYTGNKLERVVVGIGLNVNQTDFSDEIGQPATSIRIETGSSPVCREELMADLLSRAELYYRQWATGDVELLKKINRNLQFVGDLVQLDIDGCLQQDAVKFLGTNERGELLVLNKEWKVDTFSYEQIRIRKYTG